MNGTELKNIVTELVGEADRKKQIKILQKLNTKLLTEYAIKIGDEIIHPIRVEAYYYNEKNFPDCNTHQDPNQMDHFGQLYFHNQGRGGIDLCLSSGDYCLSFLIKNSFIETNGESKDYKQIDLYDKYIAQKEKLKDQIVLCELPSNQSEEEHVFHTVRKGAHKGSFAEAPLAALTDIGRKDGKGNSVFDWEPGYGKEFVLARYTLKEWIENNTANISQNEAYKIVKENLKIPDNTVNRALANITEWE